MTNNKRKLQNLLLATASTFVMLSASNAMAVPQPIGNATRNTATAPDPQNTAYLVDDADSELNINDTPGGVDRKLSVAVAAAIAPVRQLTFSESFILHALSHANNGATATSGLEIAALAPNKTVTLTGDGAVAAGGFVTAIAASDATTYSLFDTLNGNTHPGIKAFLDGANAHGLTLPTNFTGGAGLKLGVQAHTNQFNGTLGTDGDEMHVFEVLTNGADGNSWNNEIWTKTATLSGNAPLAFNQNVNVTEGGWAPTAAPVTLAADKHLKAKQAVDTGTGLLTMDGTGILESEDATVTIGAGGFTNLAGVGFIKGKTGVVIQGVAVINAPLVAVTAETGNVTATAGDAAVTVKSITATGGAVSLIAKAAGGGALRVTHGINANTTVATGAQDITGNIVAGTGVTTGDGAITGDVTANTGHVVTGAGAITGHVKATAGSVSLGGNVGQVTAGTTVTNTAAATVAGALTAAGKVIAGTGVLTVTGATGAVGIDTTAAKGIFNGAVTSTEDIIAGSDSEFNGAVTATGKNFRVLPAGATLNHNLNLGATGELDISDSGADKFKVTGDRTITAKAIVGKSTDSFTITGDTMLQTSLGSISGFKDKTYSTPENWTLSPIADVVVPGNKILSLSSANHELYIVASIKSATGQSDIHVVGGDQVFIFQDLGAANAPHNLVTISGNDTIAGLMNAKIYSEDGISMHDNSGLMLSHAEVYSDINPSATLGDQNTIGVIASSKIYGKLAETNKLFELIFPMKDTSLTVDSDTVGEVKSRIGNLKFAANNTMLEYRVSTDRNTTVYIDRAEAQADGFGTLKFLGEVAMGYTLKLDATGGGDFGDDNKKIGMIDAGSNEITLDSSGQKLYVKDIKAAIVKLEGGFGFANSSKTEVASYNAAGDVQFAPGSILTADFIPLAGAETTVGSGVTFANTTLVASEGPNSGEFHYLGSNTVKAIGSQARPAVEVRVQNDKVTDQVKFTDVVWGPILLHADSKAIIEADIHGNLDAVAPNSEYVFANRKDITIAGTTGATTQSKIVMDTTHLVHFTGKHQSVGLEFKQPNGQFKISGVDSSLRGITGDAVGSAKIIAAANYRVSNDLAEAAAPLGEFQLSGNNTLTIDAAHKVHAKLVSSSDGRTDVLFSGESDSEATNWGTSANPHDAFTTSAGEVKQGNIYARVIRTGGALTGNNVISANPITLGGVLTIRDGGSVSESNSASVTLVGGATVKGNAAGGLTSVGAKGKVVTLETSSISGQVVQGSATFALTKDTVFEDTYSVTAGTLELANYVPTFKDTLSMTGLVTMTFDYREGQPVANIVTNGPTLAADAKLILKPSKGATRFPKNGAKITVFEKSGVAATITDATADNVIYDVAGLSFVKSAKFDPTTGVITIESHADVKDLVLDNTTSSAKLLAATIAQDVNNGKASELGDYLQTLQVAERSEVLDSLANQSATAAVSGAAANASSAALATTTAHLGSVTTPSESLGSLAASGVSSGDTAERFGVWAEALAGMGTQKARKSEDGFKSKWFGGIIGADTMISDKSVLGISLSGVNNTIKLTDSSAGSKIKAPSWVFGAYGSYDFGNNFFAQANLAIAQVSARSNTVRAGVVGTATAKFDIMTSAAELRAGYNYRVDNVLVTPTVGARIDYVGDASFTETSGVAALNKKISTKASTTVSAVAGLKLATAIDMAGTTVMPEAHMNLKYAFSAQNAKSSFAVGGGNAVQYQGPKPSKYGANVGFGLTAQYEGFEYGVGYDATIADKYLGHQGSVKLKVKF